MRSPRLIISFLFTAAFSLSTVLASWHANWDGSRSDRGSALAVLMGDSRRVFAEHFFAKADIYYHSGYYPSIFDAPKKPERSHMEQQMASTSSDAAGEDGHVHDEHCDHGEAEEEGHEEAEFLNKPRDIIEAFGRNFFITSHSHLAAGEEREMLPWLRLAAEMDPQKVQTYTISSYWLRSRINKPKEAEQFLREGLRENPDSYEILFELGRIQKENYKNSDMARNLWELALRKWQKQEAAGQNPDEFNLQQILGFLGTLEEEQGRFEQAIAYFEALKGISPSKDVIEHRIHELREASAATRR